MKIRKEKLKLEELKLKEDSVKVKMMDDGYCEYDRIGVGVLDGRVFVCDLEFVDYNRLDDKEVFDDGSELKYFWFVNFESVEEVCLSGVEFGWCEEWKKNDGYGEDDRFRFCIEDCDVEGFDKWVKINEVSE